MNINTYKIRLVKKLKIKEKEAEWINLHQICEYRFLVFRTMSVELKTSKQQRKPNKKKLVYQEKNNT